MAKLGSVCRRVYRIFSHAYFHHRQIFETFEAETHLCRRFTVFVTKYKLMTRDNLIVPILEGEEENNVTTGPGSQSSTTSAVTASTTANASVTRSYFNYCDTAIYVTEYLSFYHAHSSSSLFFAHLMFAEPYPPVI